MYVIYDLLATINISILEIKKQQKCINKTFLNVVSELYVTDEVIPDSYTDITFYEPRN